jgi:alkylation response protein AidB-like acyl-CoA dehydrogenase
VGDNSITQLTAGGPRRSPDSALPTAAQAGTGDAFAAAARAVLDAVASEVGWIKRPAVGNGDNVQRDQRRAFDRALARRGWAGLAVPVDYGGAGRTLTELATFSAELAALGISTPYNRVGVGIVAPALLLFGTESQKRQLLPPLLATDCIWCQGFSEPEAGSDLAALRTSAAIEGGQWTINGRKIWTTLASEADYCLALARTGREQSKHQGITALLVPMRQSGVQVTPITQLDGERDFAEVTFDAAHAKRDAVLGEVGQGWSVAMAALSYERSLHLLQRQLRLSRMVDELHRSVRWSEVNDRAADDMVEIAIAVRSLKSSVHAQLTTLQEGRNVGVNANSSKVLWSETYQSLARLGVELALSGAGPDVDGWLAEYYSSLATSIYAGTNEIQRTIIAERGLGLPRR